VFVLNFAVALGCAPGRQGPPPGGDAFASSRRGPPGAALGAAARSSAEPPGRAGEVLERGAFVRDVLRRNPSIESARSGFRAALARTEQAGSFEDPMLEVGIAPLSIGSSQAPFGYEVALSQKLPWFGKRALEQASASAEADAAKSDYEAVERELALTAVTLYDQYFVTTRSLEINAQHIALMQSMRSAAAAQFASGRGSVQDALQAEAELTHLEHDAVMLATERDVTVAQMNELLHRAPELALPPPVAELSVPAVPDAPSTRLQGEAVEHRPDIVAVRERARAEVARAERAEREGYPDFTLSTSYNSMWDMPEHRWMVGVGLNVPIQRGRRAGAADEARAMHAQFEHDAARLSDAARTQVFVSLKQLTESRHVLELYEKRLLPVAQRQIDAARAGFSTSQNPFVSVVDAERNLRRVELDYQAERAGYGVRRAELDRALGRIPALDWKEASP
jgi:outer membrane protein TolC